jgi:hypothetical protein
MTGARLAGHILLEGQRRKAKYGVVTMCIAGGMGAAGLSKFSDLVCRGIEMDLQSPPKKRRSGAEVQTFLKEKLPANIAKKVKAGQRSTKEDQAQWHAISTSAAGAQPLAQGAWRSGLGSGREVHLRYRVRPLAAPASCRSA